MILKFFKRHWRILFIEALLCIITFSTLCILRSDTDKIHVAVVLKESNSDIENALKIYAQRINKYGGIKSKDLQQNIDGKTLEFQYEYDKGSPAEAQKIAKKLATQGNLSAVIAHSDEQTILAAAEIYNEAKKPLLLPMAHRERDMPWVFQVSPTTENYGVYTAYYVKNILAKQLVTIIRSENQDDREVAESFEKTFLKIGGKIENKFLLSSDAQPSDKNKIIAQIKEQENNMLFLA
ncbi:MAG: ABC transporter substrate-binding protein, partial [Candidatus Electrothrix sp. AR3]|nr:ABC transporter substrate-binding protein [Candidatus Electrothrix sp. AR3]